jgi:sodium-dependent dicarboxylate transporter 2/3/5
LCSLVLLAPAPQGLSAQGQRAAALFAGILVLWATEAIPIAVTALLALILQPVFRLASLANAFAGFMSPVFFFAMVMFIIAFAWSKSGLARRFSLWIIAQAGTSATRVVHVFVLGAGVLSTIVADIPCAAIFMAIAVGIFEKLKLRPGQSRFGKALMLGIPIGALIGGVGTPAGSAINILGLSLIEQQGGPRIPFLYWMVIGIPMVMIMLPIAAWVITKFYPPEIETIGDMREIHSERKAMGPVHRNEWKVIAIMTIMMTLWILSTWIPALDVTLIAVAGACVMFLPGIRLMNWQEAQGAIGWEVLVMFGGINSLGAMSASSGLAKWMVNTSLTGVENWNAPWVILLISAFTVVVHLMLPSNPVINAVMIPPIMFLAMSSGKNPALYALPVAFTASCAFLLPLESVPLVTFSKGYYRMFDMFVPGAIISAVWVLVMTALLLVIGPALGFF